MKISITRSTLAAVASAVMLAAIPASAQTAVSTTSTSTTTSAGTISEFSPGAIVIRSETSTTPMRYTYTKTTTYVDETGAPVSLETVKSGLPVTVYYSKEGDGMVATKVIVRKAVSTSGGAATSVEKKSSTTTTTTEKD